MAVLSGLTRQIALFGVIAMAAGLIVTPLVSVITKKLRKTREGGVRSGKGRGRGVTPVPSNTDDLG
jgi:hypothetical protein